MKLRVNFGDLTFDLEGNVCDLLTDLLEKRQNLGNKEPPQTPSSEVPPVSPPVEDKVPALAGMRARLAGAAANMSLKDPVFKMLLHNKPGTLCDVSVRQWLERTNLSMPTDLIATAYKEQYLDEGA